MERRTLVNTVCGVGSGGGAAAMIGAASLPADSAYLNVLIIGGAAAIILSFIGWAYLWITARKNTNDPHRQSSAFLKSEGGGQFDIEDSSSTADTFLDVKGSPIITSKRNRHKPDRRS